LRISFFGGGTDYPDWIDENGGAVLATTIDKYIYITCRYLPPFFEHKSRIVWSLVETVKDNSEIKHPSVKVCLKYMKVAKGVEIHYDADLPARTGLGSSSAFTVGLLNDLYGLRGKIVTKTDLAKEAIYIEQKLLKENVGCQDQILASFGGFNLIEFYSGNNFRINPITISEDRLMPFQKHLMLLFTGFSRSASEIAGGLIDNFSKKKSDLREIKQMAYEGLKILDHSHNSLKEFGKLLHESWRIKRGLTGKITNNAIDEIYSTAHKAGAYGGKLLGAGGGGFMLLFAPPELQPKIRNKLNKFLHVPVAFENLGSQIIFYQPQKY
jgi:D-glycero-alpha-D-manno-heptose-7-phosphate kinase